MRLIKYLWEDRDYLAFMVVVSLIIIIVGQFGSRHFVGWLPVPAGFWVSYPLVHGSYRFFDWGGRTAEFLGKAAVVAAVVMLLIRYFLVIVIPAPAQIVYDTVLGLIIGVGPAAMAIARRHSRRTCR